MMFRKPKPHKPTDENFNAAIGQRYAQELQHRQQAGQLGVMHNTSHNLDSSEVLLSEMVMKGLNNLAHMTLSMQMEKQLAYAPATTEAGPQRRHHATR